MQLISIEDFTDHGSNKHLGNLISLLGEQDTQFKVIDILIRTDYFPVGWYEYPDGKPLSLPMIDTIKTLIRESLLKEHQVVN